MSRGVTRTPGTDESLEVAIGRLLTLATRIGVGLVGVGVALMLVRDVSPLAPVPALDPGSVVAALAALRPEGPLVLGLAVIVASPVVRVLGALVGYVASDERRMAATSVAILIVLLMSIALGLGATP